MSIKSSFLIVLLSAFMLMSCSKTQDAESATMMLNDHWEIFSSVNHKESGVMISDANYLSVDKLISDVPTTVFNAQISNGICKDVYVGNNLEKISKKAYQDSWWYRKTFYVDYSATNYELQFNGINYKANIWLNGNLIADSSEVNNAFKMFRYDVSQYIKSDENVLAVEVFPPKAGDFSIGFVDWNPAPPDNNMGIFRPVYLNSINKIQILNTYVENHFENGDYSLVEQTISMKLKNFTDKAISGKLKVYVHASLLEKDVVIAPHTSESLVLSYLDYPELVMENPALWWPHTLGEPVLHDLAISFEEDGVNLCHKEMQYGIRELKDYYTAEGHRGFIINGEKISIRGAGWVDNMNLNNTHDYDLAQLEYVKSMNLNTIRLEGFWGKDEHLYETCDELGILIMVGWSCHWEWENYLGKYCDEKYGGILSDADVDLMSAAWRDQLVWLRNHPSIIAWFSGSDCIPLPALEKKYANIFHEYDSSRVYLSSAKEWESADMQTGVKMRGPYAYVPPIYWYADTLYGGAFGFNTETGPGAQVPPLESIKKMIPQEDLWPINDVWNFHCGRNEFNNLDRYTHALNKRYGEANSVEEYAQKAQLLNYELMRPMFEAFSVNRYSATGVVQWMLNSAWPEMYWQLYDSYLMPNGAFYATKKAGEPLQAVYNYESNSVYVVNDRLEYAADIELIVNVYDIDSKLIYHKSEDFDMERNSSKQIVLLPELNDISETYFLDLRLLKEDEELANNFYWLSTKKDVLDYEATIPSWYYHTPSKEYASFQQLNTMKDVEISSALKIITTGNNTICSVDLENKSDRIAFFIQLSIIDETTGNTVLPILWSDNYISLMPGEKRNLRAQINNKYLTDKNLQLRLEGINLMTETHK